MAAVASTASAAPKAAEQVLPDAEVKPAMVSAFAAEVADAGLPPQMAAVENIAEAAAVGTHAESEVPGSFLLNTRTRSFEVVFSGSDWDKQSPASASTRTGDQADSLGDFGSNVEDGVAVGSGDGVRQGRCRLVCTSEMKTLLLVATLFTTITLCQVYGAVLANSSALMMDCISMGVDAGTMYCNMVSEALKGTRCHTPVELMVGFVSLLMLTYFTLGETLQNISVIHTRGSADQADEDDVNPYIVLGFAIGGLIFDTISLYSFRRSHKKSGSGKAMNMWTAVMHVGADFLRSSTTLVLSLLIIFSSSDSILLDAWASVVVGSTILAGAACGFVGWACSASKYLRSHSRK